MTYGVARLDELDRVPVMEGLEWRPVRRRLGIQAFGVNAYTSEKVGDWVVEEHTEGSLRHEELYLVLRGRATFTLGDETRIARAGDFLIAPPGVPHAFRNTGSGPLRSVDVHASPTFDTASL